jgi:hypothetical protein
MDVNDLPRLLPPQHRSRRRVATNSSSIDEEITDMKVLLSILNIYAAIRGFWEHDKETKIAPAINAFISKIVNWEHFENTSFKDFIVGYFLIQFRMYQASDNPEVWLPPPEPTTSSI